MWLVSSVLAAALLVPACHEAVGGAELGDEPPAWWSDVELTHRSLDESDEPLLNPERGFYVGHDLLGPPDLSAVRASGHTLVIAVVRLDDYRNRPLDEAFFEKLQAGFDAAADAGVKYVLRFSYNAAFTDDAPLDQVLEHIEQLAPYLRANAGVISVMQAGFIGAWGEWHGSTNGLDSDEARAAILAALLEALPAERAVQVRTPMFKEQAYPGGPLTLDAWEAGGARARLGHHNDCFLASDDDLGTYADPVEQWTDYVAEDTLFAPMGGETCGVYPARTDCAAAVPQMEAHHWTYLNAQYRQEVLDGWQAQGCAEQVDRRLGYRLAATDVSYAARVSAGDRLPVELEIVNRGFAAPFNERPVYLVLRGEEATHVHWVEQADPRRWAAGETVTVRDHLDVPSDLPPGVYSLALWLPDADAELTGDARYAIRLANSGVWDDATGDNVLAGDIVVD